MLKLPFAIVLSLVLSFALVACGGDDDDDSPSGNGNGGAAATQATTAPEDNDPDDGDDDGGAVDSDFHACDLFTGAELGEALGVEMNDGRDYLAVNPRATNCTWEGGVVLFVEVLLKGGDDWYDTVHIPGSSIGETEEIEGIGDRALWDDFLNSLDVVDGDRYISVQAITGFTDFDSKEVAIQVAEMAIERLR